MLTDSGRLKLAMGMFDGVCCAWSIITVVGVVVVSLFTRVVGVVCVSFSFFSLLTVIDGCGVDVDADGHSRSIEESANSKGEEEAEEDECVGSRFVWSVVGVG